MEAFFICPGKNCIYSFIYSFIHLLIYSSYQSLIHSFFSSSFISPTLFFSPVSFSWNTRFKGGYVASRLCYLTLLLLSCVFILENEIDNWVCCFLHHANDSFIHGILNHNNKRKKYKSSRFTRINQAVFSPTQRNHNH